MKLKSARYSQVKRHKGSLSATGLTLAIVVAEFNEHLTNQLLDGALDTLTRLGADEKKIHVVYVPGAFEIPIAAQRVIKKFKPDVVITLGVVIKGKTKHFDQVVREAAEGIRVLSLETSTPIILGIVPATTIAQAVERVGVKQMNKGREWALAAVETANLLKRSL